jgi:hypothetical protein
MLANGIQIPVALRAFFDTAMLTRAKTNHEFYEFSSNRRGLRVTCPTGGAQRSNYLLQLSFHVAVLAQMLSTLYAWMISIVVHWQLYTLTFMGDPQVDLRPHYDLFPLQTSTVKAVALGLGIGFFPYAVKKYFPKIVGLKSRAADIETRPLRHPCMPYPATNSLVISAACHSLSEEGDISQDRIKWGVVREDPNDRTQPGHCSFSKNEVTPPIDGHLYTGIIGDEASGDANSDTPHGISHQPS